MADNKFMLGSKMSSTIYTDLPYPLDSKTVVKSKSDLLSALPVKRRSERLFFYIIDEKAFFSFQGGIADSNLKKIEGGGNSTFSLEAWISNKAYEVDEYVVYDKEIYQCISNHTSSLSFEADIVNWNKIVGKDRYSENILTPTDKWQINHNLNLVNGLPTCMYLFDQNGDRIYLADIEFTDKDNLAINFDIPITGRVEIIK